MHSEVPERDWKVFREVRERALERLCEQALRDARAVIEDSSRNHHERFRELLALAVARNELVARGFDDPKRSAMLPQLAFIRGLGLPEDEELARFSEGTQERLRTLEKLR